MMRSEKRMPEDDLPLLTFADAESLERWLDEQDEASPGAWLRFAKQGAPESTVSKSDAIAAGFDPDVGRIALQRPDRHSADARGRFHQRT
jgi:hypothetical protein